MGKYIDANRLREEIKKEIAEIESEPTPADRETILLQMCKINAFREVLSIMNRLHQESKQSKKEVADMIADWISRNPDFFFNADPKDVINELKKLI